MFEKASVDIVYSRLVRFAFRMVLKDKALCRYSSTVLRFSIELEN